MTIWLAGYSINMITMVGFVMAVGLVVSTCCQMTTFLIFPDALYLLLNPCLTSPSLPFHETGGLSGSHITLLHDKRLFRWESNRLEDANDKGYEPSWSSGLSRGNDSPSRGHATILGVIVHIPAVLHPHGPNYPPWCFAWICPCPGPFDAVLLSSRKKSEAPFFKIPWVILSASCWCCFACFLSACLPACLPACLDCR